MVDQDVPSPIDLCDPGDAREWERTAQARPGRLEMFDAFVRELNVCGIEALDVLDLGAGPGFLAAHLLDACPNLRVTLLDFSAPMQELARARLRSRAGQVSFVERSFKSADWQRGLGPFDVVLTNQAVHELRHKRYAGALHAAVRQVLKPGGRYLVSDHFFGDGGLQNDQLYMTVAEQRAALLEAGFSKVEKVATFGTLVMHRASEGPHDPTSGQSREWSA